MFLMIRFLAIILIAAPSLMHANMKVVCFQKEAVKSVRTILDAWNIELWREYPYLYVFQEETDYNSIFEEDPEAFVLFAERDGVKLGLLQANPLDSSFLKQDLYTPYGELDKFRANGFDLSKILYISCFLMGREERSNFEAINLLFDKTIEQAKKMGKTQICYMEIIEDDKHPLRPVPYIPLEPWRDLEKNFRTTNIIIEMRWPTLKVSGEVMKETHKMAFYILDIE
jgi:hypothetical protein